MSEFADACHLEQVRRALWKEGSSASASVMVGAGFSRNATPLKPHGLPFPSWKTLIAGIVDALYPSSLTADSERKRAQMLGASPSGMLALAQEYEAAFGRAPLDSFVRSMIPDLDFAPGRLHQLLLSLPWADVLTTNYDTLLERATKDVYQRRYHVITKTERIPSSHRPRIVKLHGSFPSDTPFILTEEDFRCYRL